MAAIVNPKTGKKLFLHTKEGRGKCPLYFFSYDPLDSIEIPQGFEIRISRKSGHPYITKIGAELHASKPKNIDYW